MFVVYSEMQAREFYALIHFWRAPRQLRRRERPVAPLAVNSKPNFTREAK